MFAEKLVEKKPDTTGAQRDQHVAEGAVLQEEPQDHQRHEPEAPKEPVLDTTTQLPQHDDNEEQAPIPQNDAGQTNKPREEIPLEVLEALEAAKAKEDGEKEKEQQEIQDQQPEIRPQAPVKNHEEHGEIKFEPPADDDALDAAAAIKDSEAEVEMEEMDN